MCGLIARVLCDERIGVYLCLRYREEQPILVDIVFANGFQELDGIVAVVDSNHVEPPMSFERKLHTPLMNDFLPHFVLGQSRYGV